MELDNIKSLLEKYFEAETTIAEENDLRSYFSSSDVAPELEQYKPIFAYFLEAKNEQPNHQATIRKSNKRKNLTWISIAASVVVLLGIGAFYFNQETQDQDLGSFENPEIAFRETQKALDLLSGNFNKGVQSVQYVKEYEIAKDKVFITN